MNTRDKTQLDNPCPRKHYRWAAAGLAAGACLTLCCAGTVAIYARDVLIDPKVGDLASNVQGALEKLVESKNIKYRGNTSDGGSSSIGDNVEAALSALKARVEALEGCPAAPQTPGWFCNLAWNVASNVATITGVNGKALSTTHPGYIVVPSTTFNRPVVKKVVAPVKLDAFVSLKGWFFGVRSERSWGSIMPFFIYAIHTKDGEVVFGITRNPTMTESPSQGFIGDSSREPQNTWSSQNKVIVMAAVKDLSMVAQRPAVLVGATFMTKGSGSGAWWSFDTTNQCAGLGARSVRCATSRTYTMPPGQNWAASGKYFMDNNGTAPSWTSINDFTYTIDKDGYLEGWFQFSGGEPRGAGKVALKLAIPYVVPSMGHDIDAGMGKLTVGIAGKTDRSTMIRIDAVTAAPIVAFWAEDTVFRFLNNEDMSTAGSAIRGHFRVKVF